MISFLDLPIDGQRDDFLHTSSLNENTTCPEQWGEMIINCLNDGESPVGRWAAATARTLK